MKIVFVSMDQKIFDPNSSVRKRMLDYGNLFDELHIVIFTRKDAGHKDEQIADNVFIYTTDSKNRWHYITDAINKIKKLKDIDVVSGDGPETGLAAYNASTFLDAKFHLQLHTDFFVKNFKKLNILNFIRVQIIKNLLPKANGIRVVSERIKESILLKNFKLKSEPVVLPIFQDMSDVNESENYFTPEVYKNFETVLLTVGRLESEKNIDYVIDLTEKIVRNDKKFGLVIVGDGSQKELLENKVKSKGLDNNIKFVGWVEYPWQYYEHADIFIQVSSYEGFGRTLLEAAYAGLPIISTDVGLVGELLIPGESMILLERKLSEDEKNLNQLIQDRDLRESLGNTAKEDASNYILGKNEYLQAFKKVFEI